MTIRFANWLRSEYCEPPKPRFVTSRGFSSLARVSHRAILEEPVKTMLPNLGGLTLSCSSNLRIKGSPSWVGPARLKQKNIFGHQLPQGIRRAQLNSRGLFE